ncbi:MAG: nitroreductase family protein [Pseudomonadota bacterium]
MPRENVPPWDAIAWPPRMHLALFVHRVEGLAPGVYLFLRNGEVEPRMRAELSDEFLWQRVEGCPAHLSLFRVVAADARNAAKALSCHQGIAADSAFSLGMLAEYESALAHGPWAYRQLFWEAGMLGQVLYLEAEAAGVRGTGIGCFFDDGVHDLLGIKGRWLQSLYHFTVGGALNDTRLQTLPPYAHLQRR